jgi:hypothetical protein
MGNPNFGRDRTLCLYLKLAHAAPGARGSRSQRTRVSHGNMRAKLPDYIGQVFECKADNPYCSRKGIAHWWGEVRLT